MQVLVDCDETSGTPTFFQSKSNLVHIFHSITPCAMCNMQSHIVPRQRVHPTRAQEAKQHAKRHITPRGEVGEYTNEKWSNPFLGVLRPFPPSIFFSHHPRGSFQEVTTGAAQVFTGEGLSASKSSTSSNRL